MASICWPRVASVMSRARARRSWRRSPSTISLGMGWAPARLEKFDDRSHRRTRTKHAGHSHFEQLGDVRFGNDAADQDADVAQCRRTQLLHDLRHERHVGAAKNADAEPIGIFIGYGSDYRIHRLPQASVNDMHPRV